MSNTTFCARAVSLDQTYYAATRLSIAPTTAPVERVKASAERVRIRKAMIAHVKECGLC